MTEEEYLDLLRSQLGQKSSLIERLLAKIQKLEKDLAQLQCDLITERLKSDRLEKEDEKLRKLAYGGDP